jgi:diguanylate cyclase (GGDEF)-like protein
VSSMMATPLRVGTLLDRLVRELADAEDGLEFVYHALDLVCRAAAVPDALLVADRTGLAPNGGRQLFCLGGDPRGFGAAADPLALLPGLYLAGEGRSRAALAPVADLLELALRLEAARHDAAHDPLTGLANRRRFDEALAASAAQARRQRWPFTLVVLDVDGFKAVNDRYGHAMGDRVLVELASELRRSLRASDVAARIGGDELAVLLADGTPAVAARLRTRLGTAVRRATGLEVKISIGTARAPEESVDAEELFERADRRLYAGRARRRAAGRRSGS